MHRTTTFRLGLALAAALTATSAATTASAQYPGAVAVPVQPGALQVGYQAPGTAFRWSDGDWVVRVNVRVTNMSGVPMIFHPRSVNCSANNIAMTYWAPAASMQGPTTVMPGQSVAGTLAWYYSGRYPQPGFAVVQAPGSPPQTLPVMAQGGPPVVVQPPPPVAVPVPPPPPVVVPVPPPTAVSPVNPAVQFRIRPRAEVFRWSDNDWIARVFVTIINRGPVPVQINPSSFDAIGNGMPMNDWSAAGTLRQPFILQPGQAMSGTIAWYYGANNPPPGMLMITYQGAPWMRQVARGMLVPGGHIPGAVH